MSEIKTRQPIKIYSLFPIEAEDDLQMLPMAGSRGESDRVPSRFVSFFADVSRVALWALSLPYPYSSVRMLCAMEFSLSADIVKMVWISSGLRFGFCDSSKDAVPATRGDANDVPLAVAYADIWFPDVNVGSGDIKLPGATISNSGPWLEKFDRVSLELELPTEIVSENKAGYVILPGPGKLLQYESSLRAQFPLAAKTVVPLFLAYLMTSSRG